MTSYENAAKPAKQDIVPAQSGVVVANVPSDLHVVENPKSLKRAVAELNTDDPDNEEGRNVCEKSEVHLKHKSSKQSKQ